MPCEDRSIWVSSNVVPEAYGKNKNYVRLLKDWF